MNEILYLTDILLCSKTEYAKKHFRYIYIIAGMGFYGTSRIMRQIEKDRSAPKQYVGRLYRLSSYLNYSFQCAGTPHRGHL